MKLRHSLLVGVVAVASVGALLLVQNSADAASVRPLSAQHSSPGSADSLRALGARVGLRIGTAVNTDALASDSQYAAITGQQFSTVTPENVMKWDTIEPQQGVYNYAPADQLVAFAQAHGQLVRGHNLVWNSQQPAWFSSAAPTMTSAQVATILKQHIFSEVSHFKGKIWQWDVVNEPFNEDGTLRDDIWLDKLGPSYIADAFRWAHEADPRALLFLNDYNIEYTGPKSDGAYTFVQQLKTQHVPISGVGFESHLDTQYGLPDLQNNLQRFANLGLSVAVTENDVRTTLPVTNVEQSAQNAGYSETLNACLAVAQCISYTVWGFDDGHSWIPGVFPGEGAADIYDANYQPKPQYTVLQQNLQLASGAPHRAGIGAFPH